MAGMTGGSADLRIVLLGKTGTGKSSIGNTILGERLFNTSSQANSETSKCVKETRTVDRRSVTVVDTPGYFSGECPNEKLKPEIVRCIVECAPGAHAFLIVLSVGRQTPEDKKVVEEILKTFGKEALRYAVVLFTHGEQLDHKVTIRNHVDDNIHLKKLVQKCGDRLHVIDNRYWNDRIPGRGDETRNSREIRSLLNTIDQMVKQNGNRLYTNEMLQTVEQAIFNATKEAVYRYLIQATTGQELVGLLMGAFLGAIVGVAAVQLGWTASLGGAVLAVLGAFTGWIIGANAETVGETIERVTAFVNSTAAQAEKIFVIIEGLKVVSKCAAITQ